MGHGVYNALVKLGKSEHLLLHLGTAVLDYALHFLVHQLDASQRGLLEPTDLPLNQELERNLGHEERGSGSGGVSDGGEYVHLGQASQGVNGVEGLAEGLVEYVADSGSTAELRGLDVAGRALDRRAVAAGELCDYLEEGLAFVAHVLAV